MAAAFFVALLLLPVDTAIVNALGWKLVTNDGTVVYPWLKTFAKELSEWGNVQHGTLAIIIVLWCVGLRAGYGRWRRAAMATLLAVTLAGVSANVLRGLTGRGRPQPSPAVDTIVPGFHGPSVSTDYNSFPSAHSATTAATATAVVAALGPVGWPVVAGAVLVAGSRIHLRRHHLSDVLVGMAFGILFGVPFGAAARRPEAADEAVPATSGGEAGAAGSGIAEKRETSLVQKGL